MVGMAKDSMADEVFSSGGSYVNREGTWGAGRNFRNPDRSSGLKVKNIRNITSHKP
jgi:hypothetical protein